MPTGVTVSKSNRIFVNYPYWSDDIKFTVAELDLKSQKEVPFPPKGIDHSLVGPGAWNTTRQNETLVSVQSVVVDPLDRLWILDTGRPTINKTMQPASYGGPKLIAVALNNNTIVKTIFFPETVALPQSYLNDIRFDLRILTQGVAYITDSSDKGANGIVVVDLETGASWRRLDRHPSTLPTPSFVPSVSGLPIFLQPNASAPQGYMTDGSDGIALSSDGLRLFYTPLASRRIFSVSTRLLADPIAGDNDTASTVIDHGEKGGTSDGLEADDQGNIYITNQDQNAILRGRLVQSPLPKPLPNAKNNTNATTPAVPPPPVLVLTPFIRDPRIQWADTLSVSANGRIYFTSNQLHLQGKFWKGEDRRQRPFVLFSAPLEKGVRRVELTCETSGLVPCDGSEAGGELQCRC
ncbi:major royal jelly protein-domain-containing protein [Fimicolochytrium jonesii]|uniref:major royal jelly protein-domain-containing protein n=1 Tax=Fimicolochytrium jonesii TaxID=1396493 RepID=UPI0022FE7E1B|nr:major royal jelly protein-domain-containing protein [Fimicolochytrium jonesii]KAI8817506.1 major royal jelly protein-domain-containing protein [Fimicolochytrium jonesii]